MEKNISLEKKILKLGDRFMGMSKSQSKTGKESMGTNIQIELDFSSTIKNYKWVIFGYPIDAKENNQIIKVVKRSTPDNVFIVFSRDKSINFIDLINHGQTIIDVNVEIENKTLLMETKMKELASLINNLSYNELKSLTFKYKKNRKKKDEVIESESPSIEEFKPVDTVNNQPLLPNQMILPVNSLNDENEILHKDISNLTFEENLDLPDFSQFDDSQIDNLII